MSTAQIIQFINKPFATNWQRHFVLNFVKPCREITCKKFGTKASLELINVSIVAAKWLTGLAYTVWTALNTGDWHRVDIKPAVSIIAPFMTGFSLEHGDEKVQILISFFLAHTGAVLLHLNATPPTRSFCERKPSRNSIVRPQKVIKIETEI